MLDNTDTERFHPNKVLLGPGLFQTDSPTSRLQMEEGTAKSQSIWSPTSATPRLKP